MTSRNKLVNRTPLNNAVKNDLFVKLQILSKETKIPMSKLLDEALEDLFKKRNV